MKRTRKLKDMSEDSVENIYANQIRKNKNRLRTLKSKLKKNDIDLTGNHPLARELHEILEATSEAKSKLKAYQILNKQLSEKREERIIAGNRKSKLASITKLEISGGLPSLGKRR
ncbi:MAG: hypothetical protein Q8L20_14315 [Gammaproteobacteria bacterium]|nr:hypothetical protein [Gammaproteobacteria bacterium]